MTYVFGYISTPSFEITCNATSSRPKILIKEYPEITLLMKINTPSLRFSPHDIESLDT